MQEIAIILSSLAGVATAAAVRRMPKNKNQLLSLGASSHIKSQINTLKIEKDILTKTISRLYQADSEFSRIQKDKLLLKYQHQLGIILAKLEKLEQASKHPDLGPVGDGLITLMDQKLSKLDDRLYELSSKIANTKTEQAYIEEPEIKKQKSKQDISNPFKEKFNSEKQGNSKTESISIPSKNLKQAFELTTLTNISETEPKFPPFENEKTKTEIVNPMPQRKIIQRKVIKPKDEIIQETIQQKQKIEDKVEIVQSVASKPKTTLGTRPDLNKEVAKITEYRALPEPKQQKQKPNLSLDDDFDDDGDDLDKIKGDIMKVLSKLDQAEVE
ncbi:hypothetical protein [Nitrosopumilus sp.]|uniref:hypothetical protein n=1 Tax=Nitrosopumilus sp. TaxID=2024843 RepID=UPI00292F3881|nr:hypothetical protein [Nitrosopumilus sp.]